MAQRVIEQGVEVLARRFPDMTICEDQPVEILGGLLRGPRSLQVRP